MKLKRLFLLNLLFLITSCTLALKTPVSHVVSGSFINDEYVSTISSLELYDSINKAEQKLKEYSNLKEVDFCYYEYVSEYSLDELKEKLNSKDRGDKHDNKWNSLPFNSKIKWNWR